MSDILRFKKIRWRNLLSTGNSFTEIDFTGKPLSALAGISGSGKCVDPSTEIDITFETPELEVEFLNFLNTSQYWPDLPEPHGKEKETRKTKQSLYTNPISILDGTRFTRS